MTLILSRALAPEGDGFSRRQRPPGTSECNLHTIVRLPNGVFNPYTGIRTNLLLFTKGAPTTHVWYYEHSLSTWRQELQQRQADPHQPQQGGREGAG